MSSLPFPVSTSNTSHGHTNSHSHSRSTSTNNIKSFFLNRSKLLTHRARTTNLAVLLLSLTTLISLYYNLLHGLNQIFSSTSIQRSLPLMVPNSILSTLPPPHSSLTHLVMIPGHAIWQGCDASHSTRDTDWILQDFQKDGKHVKTYLKHLTKGAEIAVKDPNALLIFSGGQTRPDSTLTEALSYLRLSKFGNVFSQFISTSSSSNSSSSSSTSSSSKGSGGKGGGLIEEFDRVTTEDYAMDSFQNLLFSIARFKEFTGHYPSYITVIGYGMKSNRFLKLHRKALLWPLSAFNYIGIDNEYSPTTSKESLKLDYEGEFENGFKKFEKDLYGCHNNDEGDLGTKRIQRNPFRRFHGYYTSAPELREILDYCPEKGDTLFNGKLPWTFNDDQ
ncbi:hypothetical protein JCM3765_005559 [Sporobolomyces pararoseus]